jgi:hypothetical protein
MHTIRFTSLLKAKELSFYSVWTSIIDSFLQSNGILNSLR